MHPYRLGLERAFFPNKEIKIKENLFLKKKYQHYQTIF